MFFLKEKIILTQSILEREKRKGVILDYKNNLFKKYNIKVPFFFFSESNKYDFFFQEIYNASNAFVYFNRKGQKVMAFNDWASLIFNDDEIKNILLHEIAHVKLNWETNHKGSRTGHSKKWWRMFLRIGGRQDIIGGKGYY